MMTSMRRTAAAAALALMAAMMLVLGSARAALAHEGHDHKVMGTVTSIKDNHLEVKTTEGKTVAFVLTDQTKILKGKTPATRADIKPAMRVVVVAVTTPKDKQTAEHKTAHGDAMTAKEVRLGVAAATS